MAMSPLTVQFGYAFQSKLIIAQSKLDGSNYRFTDFQIKQWEISVFLKKQFNGSFGVRFILLI